MIAPRNRLLAWSALIVVPFATLATAMPGAAAPALTVVGLFAVAVLLDAASVFGLAARGQGLFALDAELPEVVRSTQRREAALHVLIRGAPPGTPVMFSVRARKAE